LISGNEWRNGTCAPDSPLKKKMPPGGPGGMIRGARVAMRLSS
jgi:hypothetical protein